MPYEGLSEVSAKLNLRGKDVALITAAEPDMRVIDMAHLISQRVLFSGHKWSGHCRQALT